MKKIRLRKRRVNIEDLPLDKSLVSRLDEIAKTLSKQIDKEIFVKKYAPAAEILKLVGASAFITASFIFPTLTISLKPFLSDQNEYEIWKRFNIPYLKRTLERLERQKLVKIKEEKNMQTVEITDRGRKRILKYALDEISIKKPKIWDGKWRLVSYDVPEKIKIRRKIFKEYLSLWGFYPLHESVFLHAYPCGKELDFIREYLGIGKYVRLFRVDYIENNKPFRDFFGV